VMNCREIRKEASTVVPSGLALFQPYPCNMSPLQCGAVMQMLFVFLKRFLNSSHFGLQPSLNILIRRSNRGRMLDAGDMYNSFSVQIHGYEEWRLLGCYAAWVL
jgi:hypothetical protein